MVWLPFNGLLTCPMQADPGNSKQAYQKKSDKWSKAGKLSRGFSENKL